MSEPNYGGIAALYGAAGAEMDRRRPERKFNSGSLVSGLIFGLLVLVGVGLGYLQEYKSISHNKLFPRVVIKADVNRDKETSIDEWKQVYFFLGRHWDAKCSNPEKDLSNKELRRYLDRNS